MPNLDETELARLEALAGESTPRPWKGDGHKGCGYGWVKMPGFNTTGTERSARLGQYLGADDDARYIAAACNSVPALVAEIRRLRESLNKEHRAWQCAEGRGDGLEMENAALREKVEAWGKEKTHLEETARVLAEQIGKGNLGKIQLALEWADEEAKKREAVHADRE